jgi:Fe-Mn family superoxide dismutase
MNTHYNKHYKGYVEKLNVELEKIKGDDLDLENIIEKISKFNKIVKNNGGGAFNHALFWKMLSPKKQEVSDPILSKIKKDFGSFEKFKEKFSEESKSKFGSGWAWLILTKNNRLRIVTTSNQDNPLMNTEKEGGYPLLGLDLWEHAYYLKYKNKRDEYIKNFWKVVNWGFVNDQYTTQIKKKSA